MSRMKAVPPALAAALVVAFVGLGTACSAPPDDLAASTTEAIGEKPAITDDLPDGMEGGETRISIPLGLNIPGIGNPAKVRVRWEAPNKGAGTIGGIIIDVDTDVGFVTICDGGTMTLTAGGLTFDCNWSFLASFNIKRQITLDGDWIFPNAGSSDGYIVTIPKDAKGRRFPPVVITVVKYKKGLVVKVNGATLDGDGNLSEVGGEIGSITVPAAGPPPPPMPIAPVMPAMPVAPVMKLAAPTACVHCKAGEPAVCEGVKDDGAGLISPSGENVACPPLSFLVGGKCPADGDGWNNASGPAGCNPIR